VADDELDMVAVDHVQLGDLVLLGAATGKHCAAEQVDVRPVRNGRNRRNPAPVGR
jgi:hypothetical protein